MVFTRQMWIVNIIIEDEEAFPSHTYTHTHLLQVVVNLMHFMQSLCQEEKRKVRLIGFLSNAYLKNQIIIPGHIGELIVESTYQMVNRVGYSYLLYVVEEYLYLVKDTLFLLQLQVLL